MPSIGPMELIVVLVIALVVFGPKRLRTWALARERPARVQELITGDDEVELPRGEVSHVEKT